MKTVYTLKHKATGDIVHWTVTQILKEINRDRSDDWEPYNITDWRDGLEWISYELKEGVA